MAGLERHALAAVTQAAKAAFCAVRKRTRERACMGAHDVRATTGADVGGAVGARPTKVAMLRLPDGSVELRRVAASADSKAARPAPAGGAAAGLAARRARARLRLAQPKRLTHPLRNGPNERYTKK